MPIGIVSVVFGSRCEVLENGVSLPCLLRGRLKHEAASLAVGDRVEFQRVDAHTGVVERVLERTNVLARSNRERPRKRSAVGAYPLQVVLANPDQVFFVAAARDPGIPFELMDRALALARAAGLRSTICVNKMDLAPEADIRRLMQPYERMGVRVLFVSAETGRGLDDLRTLLQDKVSFFWGGSGVGKSSLIRALTGAEVQVGRWRTDNPRGPHTTNVTRLYPLPFGGLIADTPGFDWLALDTVDEAEDVVASLLPEALRAAPECRFPGCSHCGEPGCAVMAAVLSGQIDRGRYARFRASVAESHPVVPEPTEMISTGDELFFRMRDGNTSLWTTFQLYYLFDVARSEREGLLETLGVPPDPADPWWAIFQHNTAPGAATRSHLTAKVTSTSPLGTFPPEGTEVILRERGTVKGIGRVREVRPTADTWRLRKALKGTPIYETRAFWSDLKPPRGVRLPPVQSALVTIGLVESFAPIPELALGVVAQQEIGWVLDFLEVGSSEDELARE